MGSFFRMKSCCGCSLSTGSLIIATIDLLSALTALIFTIAFVTEERFIGCNQIAEYQNIICRNNANLLKVLRYFLAFMSSIVIISDIVLIIGIFEERLTLVGAWVFACIASFFSFMVIISISVIYINGDNSCAGYWHISEFALFYLGFKVFFMIVVRSYANTLSGRSQIL